MVIVNCNKALLFLLSNKNANHLLLAKFIKYWTSFYAPFEFHFVDIFSCVLYVLNSGTGIA